MRWGVEGRGVEDGDTVPAGLDLDGEVARESVLRGDVVEDGFEGSVFERCAVDVARDPVVVEDGGTLCVVVSLVSSRVIGECWRRMYMGVYGNMWGYAPILRGTYNLPHK